MTRFILSSLLLVALVACAPVPVSPERAAQLCREQAGLGDGVRGNIGVGVGTGGGKVRGSITVTDKVFRPQDDQAAFEDCVARKIAGEAEPPTIGITIGAST